MQKKTIKKREFPLIEVLNKEKNIRLGLSREYYLSADITDNLKHKLRPYQKNAMFNLDWTQNQKNADYLYNHLLFNMATGSGKTDIMMGTILYMYKNFDYHNFLFVSNTDAVLNKTKNNIFNNNSDKYLFKDPIVINGYHINIQMVDTFPIHADQSSIYILLSTIQGLSNSLENVKENKITYEGLSKNKIVMLIDEAHHFNRSTKNKENILEKSWENVTDKIRQSNKKNRQFEYTATIDLQNDYLYEKYKNKILFKYSLNNLKKAKYSKIVRKLQANNSDHDKMLNAILLSQFRKKIAQKNGIDDFKPVILFKSNRINKSDQAYKEFVRIINDITMEKLRTFIEEQKKINQSSALTMAYNYWISQNMLSVIVELKKDFNEKNIIGEFYNQVSHFRKMTK